MSFRAVNLPRYQILTGNHLGDRMFDLQPCIHLHKVEPVTFQQKLHRTRADIIDRVSGSQSRLPHAFAKIIG